MRARRRDREHVSGDERGSQRGSQDGGRGNPGNNRNRGGGGNTHRRKRKRNKGKRGGQGQPQAGAGFWGDSSRLPEPTQDVRITDDPAAVARSLGAPPLPGHEQIAEHYFRVVYERAVQTAGALAAAGGLIDPEALVDEMSD